MQKTDEQGNIIAFIMEPEEELATLRFIMLHKPGMIVAASNVLWDPDLTTSEQANQLGLSGGYGVHFYGLLGGNAHHE